MVVEVKAREKSDRAWNEEEKIRNKFKKEKEKKNKKFVVHTCDQKDSHRNHGHVGEIKHIGHRHS